MEIPSIQLANTNNLVDEDNDVINQFIFCLLDAFRDPDNLNVWDKVRDYLQALGHISEIELRERRDLIHYLNRFLSFLNCDNMPMQHRTHVLSQLQHLLDTLAISSESIAAKFETEQTAKNPDGRDTRIPAPHHKTFRDDLFTFDASSLPRFTPHPPPLAISDLRASIPTVLSEVVKLNRGRKVGLGITEQSLDLSLSFSLPEHTLQETRAEKSRSSGTPPRAQLLPLPQGLKKKDITKQQSSSPKTGEDVIKYFAYGGDNRFFYLKLDPASKFYAPYQLVVDKDTQHQKSAVSSSNEVYIISAFGVIRNLSDKYTESTSLVAWQREATLFRALKTIPFFRMFPLLKVLRRWKKVTDRERHNRIREYLLEHLILQIPCFLPLLHSASQWGPRLQELQLLPETHAELVSIQSLEHLLIEAYSRVNTEVTEMYSGIIQLVENLWTSQKQELSYCEQKIELEDKRTTTSKGLPLSTQSRTLRLLLQHRAQLLTTVKLIPNLTKLLGTRLYLALRDYAIGSADSYLNYLNIGSMEEDTTPAISLEIGVFNEGESLVLECHTKWIDTYDILLTPFNEQYIDLDRLDIPLLSDMTEKELNKVLKEDDNSQPRTTKLSFVRHVVAHSLLTDSDTRSPTEEESKQIRQFKRYEGFLLKKTRKNTLREKLQEATKQHEWRLLEVLRDANNEIVARLDFLKWIEEMVVFLQIWGSPSQSFERMLYTELLEKLDKLQIWTDRMENVPDVWTTDNRLFQLDLSTLKSGLNTRLVLAATHFFEVCFNQYRFCYNEFMGIIQDTILTISNSSIAVDNFSQHTLEFDKLKEGKNILQRLKKELDEMYELLQQSHVAHVEDLEEKHAVIMPKWYRYISYLQSIASFITGQKGEVIQKLTIEFSELGQRALELVEAADREELTLWSEQPQMKRDIIHKIENEFMRVKESMLNCQEQLLLLVSEEEADSLRDQLRQITITQDNIKVRKQLWDSVTIGVKTISDWMKMPFSELKIDVIIPLMQKWKEQLEIKEVQSLNKEEVVTKWNDILQRFNSYLPSLELLVDPGMKTHFWQVLFTALGCVFPSSGVIPSINRLIFLDILTHRELIKHIHASAMVEGRLEDILRCVIVNWKSREYKLVKHKAAPLHGVGNERKETDNLMYLSQQQGFTSYVLQDPEEFLSYINDDSTRLNMVVLSNCTQSLKKRAQLWIDKLQQLTEFITIWMDCQAKWIYISSVYVEFAVLGTHTQEVERFKQLNASYQSLVNTLFENKKMLHLIGVRVEANLQLVGDTNYLIGRLLTQQRELSEMMKYLENMVEDARKIFSRAFYLSQQQILYLYIHTGNPKALLPQLKLCFPGVHNVVWVADSSADKLSSLGDVNRLGMRISYVYGVDGNNFELISPLLTGHQPGHFWLKGLEKAIQVSISQTIHRILHYISLDYLINPDDIHLNLLVSSLRDNPIQCVEMALCLTWTYVIDKSIGEDNPNLLYLLEETLSQCIGIFIKEISSPLEGKKRSAASSLIICIHNLQYCLSNLRNESSLSCDNFLWASHFKYRYNLTDSESDELIPILAISHLNYNYPYCSEYQGAAQELVLTPLTEKCVFNLSLAMYTNKLAGVIGLNGSAISETVKALCYITGRACFSLDASAFQTHAQVTNVLLGFIQSGTIGYIANLDRLKLNLSCTLVTLLQAVKSQIENTLPYKCFLYFYEMPPIYDSNIDWYDVNEFGILGELSIGGKVLLKHGYGCCVSMSSQKLPEEFSNYLHTQIHFFYFSKPSYKPMLEAHLLSHNFSSYKVLSCKVMSFLNHLQKLFEKELVAKPTDLRRVLREAITYLESAGNILGQESSRGEREMLSVYYAIWRVVKPQLAKSEIIIAKSVLNSIFPECARCIGILSQLDFDNKETADLEKILSRILVERQYRANAKEMEKIFDIYNSLQNGQNIVIFGPTLCGKTTCLQLLANALNEQNDKLVDLTTIYPHALDIASLYGWYDNDSLIWRQGLLHKLLSNKLSSDRDLVEREQWFVFDGRMQGDWIAQLHSMLSSPKQFKACDATTIQLPNTCKFIFETDTLCNVAPSLLSHCYPIPMGEGVLSWRDQLDQWLKSVTVSQGIAKSDVIDLRRYTDNTVAAILEYLRGDVAENIPYNQSLEMLYVRSFTNIMSAVLKKFYFLTYKYQKSILVLSTISEEETNYKVLDLIFVFSLAWGFGGSLDVDRKIAFSEFLSNLFQQTGITSGLSDRQDQNIFNYYIEPTKRMLVSWSDRKTDYASFGSYVQISEIDKLSVIGELLLHNGIPVFYSGPVGCGKTSMIENLLQHRVKLSSLSYSPLWTPSRLQQRIRATHLAHQKSYVAVSHLEERCTLFIDDFNIPTTQIGSPDVLRQVIESRLVYDASVNVMKPVSIQLIVCSNSVSSLSNSRVQHDRLYSHFFNLTMDDPDSATLFKIFSPPVLKWLSGHYPPLQEANRANYITQILVKTSVVVYECIRDKLKPTPATPQYSFSLFELNRLFQSIFVFTAKHIDKDKPGFKADTDKQRNKRTSITCRKKRQRLLSRYDTIQTANGGIYAIEMEDNFEYFVSVQRNIVRLWCHEHCRVYGDKISSEKDQEWFQMLLKNCMQRAFCSISEMRSASEDHKFPKISKPMRLAAKKQTQIEENKIIARHTKEMSKENFWRVKIPLNKIFAAIEEMTSLMYFRMPLTSIPESLSSPNSRDTPLPKYMYSEVTDLAFQTLLQPHLDSLNENLTTENKIIIYPFALEHIVRLSRLLQMFEGHALFCGQRRTGRKTIVRLAAALTQSRLYDMEASTEKNSFRDCLPILQAAINSSVISRAHSVVVVTGDWLPEVWHAIGELLALENVNQERITKELEEGAQFQQYRVSPIPEIFKTEISPPHYPPPLIRNLLKHNLHFVLIINSTPSSFTHFFTQYHKLVRYLTLDIVSPLCEFSLREVAHTWLSENAVNKWIREETSLDKISEVAAHIHCTAFEKAQIIYPKHDLWIYKSNIKMFIDFLKTSSKMVYVIFRKESRLTREVREAQNNLTVARLEVETMRVEMKRLEERRSEKVHDIREFEEEIDSIRMEYRNAELVNKQHVEEIKKCNEMIEMLRKDLKFQFGEVDPLYKRAGEALRELCREDIVELTTFQKPPDGVKRIAECLCVLFKRELGWSSAQELFKTKHFYQNLLYYDKEKNMTTILSSPQIRFLCSDAEMDKIAFSSKAAASVARWLIALYRHATVDKETRGKRRVLTELEEEVERLEILRGKERVKMNTNNSELDNNNHLLDTKKSEIIQFDKEIQVYRDSIRDANRIFSSLQLVEAKFNKIIVESHDRVTSIGNVLITAGAINYLTPFPSNVILELVNVWKDICGVMPPSSQTVSTASVKVTPDFSLQEMLTTEEERFYWETKKRELPQGEDYRLKLVLIRAVASFDCLWPYVYDPTGLFYKWIKSVESTFRGEEIEHLFELTKSYEEAIKASDSLPAINMQPKISFSDHKRSNTPPSFGSKSSDTASSISTSRPESFEKNIRLRRAWSQIQRRSIVKAIFSTNLHLVRCYEEEFENILEEELYRICPVPVIALSMSCLPPGTSRKVIYSEFEEREGRRYHKLEGKEVEVRADFRLYLTSNYSPILQAADVTNIDMNKVRFCSFEPARESLRDILFMILADVEMGEVQNKLDTAARDVIHFYKLMKEKRKKLLRHIIDSPSIASDLDLVKLISSTGRELERAEEGRVECQETCDKLQDQLDMLRVVSDNLEIVWYALDIMQNMCKREYCFTLAGFLETSHAIASRTVAETFRPNDGSVEGRVHYMSGVMLRETCSFYLSQMIDSDKAFFLLTLIFSTQISHGHLSRLEWDTFFSPTFSIPNCTELLNSLFSEFSSNTPPFISPEVWGNISQQKLPSNFASVIEALSFQPTEWEEYFKYCLHGLTDGLPSSKRLDPENRLYLWRETHPRDFLKLLGELFVHRMGNVLDRLSTFSFSDAFLLATSLRPLLVYTDSRECVGDCLEFVRSQMRLRGEEYRVFDLACRSSLASLELAMGLEGGGKKEWLIIINCENVSCWPQTIIRFLNVSFLCRFGDESKNKTKRIVVITRSSALNNLPLSIKSSSLKLAYNHKYFTPGERLDIYTDALRGYLGTDLDACTLLMKINAAINSGIKYGITENNNSLTGHIGFLHSVVSYLQEFFSSFRSVAESDHFITSIFSETSSLRVGKQEMVQEKPVFNRLLPGILTESEVEMSRISLLEREIASSQVSLELVEQFWSNRQEREVDLEPLLEMLDILIADVTTLLNIDTSLYKSLLHSLQTGGQQAVFKQELLCIEQRLQEYLDLLKRARNSPYHSLQPDNLQSLQLLSAGYMPDLYKQQKTTISTSLVWYKEALEYYKSQIEGPHTVKLRYHQHPLAWLAVSISEQAKIAGDQLERCIPVAKICTEDVEREEGLIGVLCNVSLAGVIFHQQSQSFSFCSSQSLSDQKVVIRCVSVGDDDDDVTYHPASLYCLGITHNPVYSCELYLPLTRKSEREYGTPNKPTLLIQLH